MFNLDLRAVHDVLLDNEVIQLYMNLKNDAIVRYHNHLSPKSIFFLRIYDID